MATKFKYAANDALNVIHNELSDELRLFHFNKPARTKAHLFGIGGRQGRQFGIVLGEVDKMTKYFTAQQTKIVLEKCNVPSIPGVELSLDQVKTSRFQNSDSKICPGDQVSVYVADAVALKRLLRWYSTKTVC